MVNTCFAISYKPSHELNHYHYYGVHMPTKLTQTISVEWLHDIYVGDDLNWERETETERKDNMHQLLKLLIIILVWQTTGLMPMFVWRMIMFLECRVRLTLCSHNHLSDDNSPPHILCAVSILSLQILASEECVSCDALYHDAENKSSPAALFFSDD